MEKGDLKKIILSVVIIAALLGSYLIQAVHMLLVM